MAPSFRSATKLTSGNLKPTRIASPAALSLSNIVRSDSRKLVGESGNVGSCCEDCAAQRPNSWISGSAA